jgi:hypothetical protein
MNKFLREISDEYTKNDENRPALEAFIRLYSNDDFRFFRESIMVLRGFIANDFLSDRFSKLTPAEKDIEHRVHKEVWEFLEFILNPTKFARAANKIERYNAEQLKKIQPTPQGKKKII